MDEDLTWKRRFLLFNAARLFGLTMILAGLFIGFTDVFVEGGNKLVGSVLALMGVADALFAPKVLKKVWEREDRDRSARR